MNPEEEKIFNEFKIAFDAAQIHTFEKYVKPQIDKLIATNKRLSLQVKSLFIIAIVLLLVNSIIIFSAEYAKIKTAIIQIIG